MQKRYFRSAQDLASPPLARYYLDTCIWIDYFENRKDRFRPLGEWALRAINEIINEEGIILISSLNHKELKKFYTEEKIHKMVSHIPAVLLKMVFYSESQKNEAILTAKMLGIPVSDALHAIIARDNSAVLITRDKHFFLIHGIDIKLPEELF